MSLPSFLFCPFFFTIFLMGGTKKNEMRRETTSEWVTRAMKNISQDRIWAFRNSTKKLNFLLLKKKGERKEESMRTSPLAPFYSLLPFSLEKGLMDCNRLTDGYVHKKAPHTHTRFYSLYILPVRIADPGLCPLNTHAHSEDVETHPWQAKQHRGTPPHCMELQLYPMFLSTSKIHILSTVSFFFFSFI